MLQHIQPKANEFIENGSKVYIGNHGFVRLVRYMGSDASIVQAARTSYGDGTKTLREDTKLLNYLYRKEHMSPFEQVVLTFHMKLPIFVARQIIRHRTARLNEMSARYTPMQPHYWLPNKDEIRVQNTSGNKQGSAGIVELSDELYNRWSVILSDCHNLYDELLEAGVAREQARSILPVALYTEWYWQIDLRNLIHFLKLRLDPHAQKETQEYAEGLLYFAKMVAPVTLESVFPEEK